VLRLAWDFSLLTFLGRSKCLPSNTIPGSGASVLP